MTGRLLLAAWGLGMLAALLTGCEESSPEHQTRVDVEAVVEDRLSGQPQSGVKLLLMDVTANRLVRLPVLTDSTGTVQFPAVEPGLYQVVAYPGAGRAIHFQSGSFRLPPTSMSPETPAGESRASGPLAPALPTADPGSLVNVVILTYPSAALADDPPRITGTVRDAENGEPLAGVFIGPPGLIDRYTGIVSVREDVTLADGAFHVADIPFAYDPVTERVFQVLPLIASRQGYAPLSWRYLPAPGESVQNIVGVEIRLRRLETTPQGGVAGQVFYRQQPVAGLPVGVVYLGEATGKELGPAAVGRTTGMGLPDVTARTGADGRFLVAGLGEGVYLVNVAYEDRDGYSPVGTATSLTIAVPDQSTAELGSVLVVRTIRPLSPPPAPALPDTMRTLVWTAVAAADSYGVWVDGVYLRATAQPHANLTEPPAPGPHSWQIVAYTVADELVGRMDAPARFLITEGLSAR